MRRVARRNSLSLVFGALFLLAVVGPAIAGRADYNQQQVSSGLGPVGYGRYLSSSHFAVDLLENWQSEFLQFFLYIWLPVWLVQRGQPSPRSWGRRVGKATNSNEWGSISRRTRREERTQRGSHTPPTPTAC